MRNQSRWVFLLLLTGCSAPSMGLPIGSAEAPIRSPCDASPTALAELGYSCDVLPPSPAHGNELYWRGERPCARVTTYLETGEQQPYRYSADGTEALTGAQYDLDGNLVQFAPDPSVAIHYEYAEGRFSAARVVPATGGEERRYVSAYEGGVRIAEGIWEYGALRPTYHWGYEGERLVVEGTPDLYGRPPVPLAREAVMSTSGDLQAGPSSGSTRTYFYDEASRLEAVGIAPGPRATLLRVDLTYDEERLVQASLERSPHPAIRPQRRIYQYRCD